MTPERLLHRLAERRDQTALLLLVVVCFLLPGGLPAGIVGLGVVSGAQLAVAAIGIVLIYRSDRIINFAQVPLGLTTAMLFRLLVEQRSLVRAVDALCGCIAVAPGWLIRLNYWLALGVSVALAAGLSFLIYHLVIRRFREAPRLVITVATIGLAGLLASIQALLPRLLATADQRERSTLPRGLATGAPFDLSLTLPPTRFDASDLSMVLLAVVGLIGLWALIRLSPVGTAIRAAADAPERALTLGIDVNRMGGRVWVIAGLLSGSVAVIAAMGNPPPEAGALAVGATVRILAVAVVARMSSTVIAVVGALVIGVFDQAVIWSSGSIAAADGAFLVVIAIALLLQRADRSRAGSEAATTWKADREIAPVPQELLGLSSVRGARRLGWTAAGLVVFGYPWAMSPSQTNAAAVVLIYAMVGMSILILTGWAGQISLGQFAFAAVGGYVTAILSGHAHFPMLLALAAGAAAGAITAVIVGIPALKIRGLNLAVSTMAFALTTSALLLDPSNGGRFLPDALARPAFLGMDLDDQRTFYYITLVVFAGVIAAVLGIRKSQVGRALIAARDNEMAAQSFGINLTRSRLAAFGLSGAISALAGGLFAFHQTGVKAAAFSPEASVSMFLMTVIGGLGSVFGPIIGAVYFGTLSLLSTTPFVTLLGTGGGLVVLLLIAPGGIAQLFASARDAWLRRIAERHNIIVASLLSEADIGAAVSRRSKILPKRRPGGGTEHVPVRYRLDGQWGVAPEHQEEKVG